MDGREDSGALQDTVQACPRAPQFTAGRGQRARRAPGQKAAIRFSPRSLPELTWQFSSLASEKGHRKCLRTAPGPSSQGSGTETFRGEGRGRRHLRCLTDVLTPGELVWSEEGSESSKDRELHLCQKGLSSPSPGDATTSPGR